MYSKMLRQFSKGSLTSISSESSKIYLLIKVLYRPFWCNICRQNFLFHALNITLRYQQQCSFIMSQYLRLQTLNNSALPMCNTCVRVTHISNLPTVNVKMTLSSRPTHLVPFTSKCQNLPKIDVYNFRYGISVRILMKLLFLSHKCICKYFNKLVYKQIYIQCQMLILYPCPFLCPLW